MRENRYILSGVIAGLAAVAVYIISGELLAALLTGIGAFAVFALLLRPTPKAPVALPEINVEQTIEQGEASLKEIASLAQTLQDKQVKALTESVCQVVRGILGSLREKPDTIGTARKFFSYYLPTLKGLLIRYGQIEKSGVPKEELKQKLIGHLNSILSAMNKLHESLYQRDMLDMSLDMEVMTRSCIQDGLLTKEDLPF